MAPPTRSTREVLADHLRLRAEGKIEEDLRRNYADDVIVLCESGVLRGRDALLRAAERLALWLPGARLEVVAERIEGEYAFLVWRAETESLRMAEGADSFLVRAGQIVAQTHYHRLHGRSRRHTSATSVLALTRVLERRS
jgi:hypothetical protein